jgi:hypothetical protein
MQGALSLLGSPLTGQKVLKTAQYLPVGRGGRKLCAELPDGVRWAAMAIQVGTVEVGAAASPAAVEELLVAKWRQKVGHHACVP